MKLERNPGDRGHLFEPTCRRCDFAEGTVCCQRFVPLGGCHILLTMFRTRQPTRQFLGLTGVIVASCALGMTAVAQTTPAQISTACSAYASVPLPAEAEKVAVPKSSPVCASYRSYRGIGRPVNYAEARRCAWQERLAQKAGLSQNADEPTAWFVGGSLILADIYFNGAGVERNIPLAVHFACESEEGMAKLALPDIEKLDGAPPAHGPFEFCQYAVTTFSMDFCVGYASEIEDDRRSRYYNSLKSDMTPEQKAAFERLVTAQKAYVTAHASEVDQGGTIRGIRTVGSEDILNDLFHTEVMHFEEKRWPALSDNQVATADTLLHSQYERTVRKLSARTKDEIYEGAVTAEHLSSVQVVWGTYRDAWVLFARLRYPSAVARIRAEITLRRCSLLKTIS